MTDPNHADIRAQAAECNPDNDPDRAIDLNARLLRANSADGVAWFRLCRAYHALGLLDMALEACDRAIALGNTPAIARRKRIEADPRNTPKRSHPSPMRWNGADRRPSPNAPPSPSSITGRLYHAQLPRGETQFARFGLAASLRATVEPRVSPVQRPPAEIAALHEARELYQMILYAQPQSIMAMCGLGGVERDLGYHDDAHATYAQALELDSCNPGALMGLAGLECDMGDYAAAHTLCRRYEDRYGTNGWLHNLQIRIQSLARRRATGLEAKAHAATDISQRPRHHGI